MKSNSRISAIQAGIRGGILENGPALNKIAELKYRDKNDSVAGLEFAVGERVEIL